MVFRASDDETASVGLAIDPWRRFLELHAALDADRGWMGDKVPLRFAAVTLLSIHGVTSEIAAKVREHDAALASHFGWFTDIGSSIRIMIAATLVKNGDTAEDFLAEAERVEAMFRAAKLRRGHVYEMLAMLIMRTRSALSPITAEQVDRFKAIYAELKRYHWWLTGPDDFPACGILVGQSGTPEEIGAGIEEIYQALHKHSELFVWRGEALQTAANVLYLSGLAATEVADRFHRLVEGFRGAKIKITQSTYDEIAVLCFLARPVESIVANVVELRDRARDELGVSKEMGLSLGTSLAFLRLVAGHAELGPLSDAKLLLDMQAIIAARQAAAAAGAAAGQASA